MGDKSAIEWTDSTWNPVSGCSKVSSGCQFCYAERIFPRVYGKQEVLKTTGSPGVGPDTRPRKFTDVILHPDRLDQPLRWRKPRRIFVNSMSDLFHEEIPDEFLLRAFCMMAVSKRHTFQVLTKRAKRMADFCAARPWFGKQIKMGYGDRVVVDEAISYTILPNVWLGVSCEDQQRADERIPLLLQTPAAVRFVSLEPLLGPIDIAKGGHGDLFVTDLADGRRTGLHWVIVGGESGGPPERSLLVKSQHEYASGAWYEKGWAGKAVRSLRDQCVAAGVPFFFKQWGGPTPKSGGRLLDGRTWDEMPKGTP